MKVCWNITSKCNKNCKYCFKFNEEDLSFKKNKIILSKLVSLGVDTIIWTGGEPYLYKDLDKLLKLSKKYGLINCLNTNASLLTKDNAIEKTKNIDKLIISLDFVNDDLNKKYGIGENYFNHIKIILNKLKNIDLDVQINTVLFSENMNYMDDLYKEISKYNIKYWKIIQFLPIRGKALEEKNNFSITNEDFKRCVSKYINKENDFEIITNNNEKMEEQHIIILSSGKMIRSENGKDIKIDKELIEDE